MHRFLTYFDPQPVAGELPLRLANPLSHAAPDALATRAADDLRSQLQQGTYFAANAFDDLRCGKMFGVLVVLDADGRIGYLKAFSGTVNEQWQVPGFADPLFDIAARDTVWPAGQAKLAAFDLALQHIARDLEVASHSERSLLLARHQDIRQQQTAVSNELLAHFFAGYRLVNARGVARTLRDVFAPNAPPGGAGDCAAPKLFACAQKHDLKPLALAEFWWGAPTKAEGRRPGLYYPACSNKCGPILRHMLQGWDVDPAPPATDAAPTDPQTLYEDECVVVVSKPWGLGCVPGRSGLRHDSVQTRLRKRCAISSVQIVAHQLGQDASGLVLAAKDKATYSALQKQFFLQALHTKFVALLDGVLSGSQGQVTVPLRSDPSAPPRQIADPLDGKTAVTQWQVLHIEANKTRVQLVPHTSRSHQLRVHTSSPCGLGIPITGDALYGQESGRLLLHCQELSFVHPTSGVALAFESPAPF